MNIVNKKESFILLSGDLVAFIFSLWIALFLRYLEIPALDVFIDNFIPFFILFIIWVVFFFIAGLYEKHRIAQRKRLPELLLKTQLFNSIIAIVFFYSLPFFGVAPKIILFLYITIYLALSFLWRVYAVSFFTTKSKSKALLIASGSDALKLKEEINNNNLYGLCITRFLSTDNDNELTSDEVNRIMKEEGISFVIVDSRSLKVMPILPQLYKLIFANVHFIDFYDLYEEVFDRLPVSIISYGWFLENISTVKRETYDFLKKIMDIVIALPLLIISLPLYIFVWLALKIQDNGSLFIVQNRIGQNGKMIKIIKFRSMMTDDQGIYDRDIENKVTFVGAILRKSRIDELPQLWNVLKGDLSLIGPRPELPALVIKYEEVVPYYNVRHIIKPGLSGWAQLYHENHPHHGIDIEETKNKLSYDLYYIKHRSFVLDIIIALKTLKTLLSSEGK